MNESRSGPSLLGRARPARHHRRAHALHAGERAREGVGVLRHRGPARRAAVADHLPHEEADRLECCGLRRARLHVDGLSAQAGDGGVAEQWAADFAARTPTVCRPRPSSRSRAPRSTCARPSTAGRGCSRRTCRSAATTRPIRCSTPCGGCSRRPACPSSSTAARARRRASTPGRTDPHGCWRRHPRLRLVVAHMGMPEYGDFLDLASGTRRASGHHHGVHGLRRGAEPFPRPNARRLSGSRRSDPVRQRLPQHPVRVRTCAAGAHRAGVGEAWLRAVCYGNARPAVRPVSQLNRRRTVNTRAP